MRIARPVLVSLLASCAADEAALDEVSSPVLVDRVGILGAGSCDYLTVGDAIANASNGDTILVEAGHTFYERLGTITDDITIRAGTAGCTGVAGAGAFATIDAGHAGRLAEVAADVTFQQMTLMNGTAGNGISFGASWNAGGNLWVSSGTTTLIDTAVFGGTLDLPALDAGPYGAGIHVGGTATLQVRGASSITGNDNPGVGAGGVLVDTGATAIFEDTTRIGLPIFGANIANQGPGGLLVMGNAELHDDAQVSGNVSDLVGGGMYIWGGEVWLFDNARVANNIAPDGGGIAVIDGTLHTSGSPEIEDNDATDEGGGIWILSGMLDIQGSTRIAGNEATDCGGGIFADGTPASTTVYLTGTTVDGNDSEACGGGVAVRGGLFDADGSTVISNNHADTEGGGVYLTSADAEGDLDNVTIATNTANRGAGLALLAGATVQSEDLTIDENTATTDGGGVLSEGNATTWNMYTSNVTDNNAGRGGGLFLSGGTYTFEETDLRRNAATTEGGGARVAVASTVTMMYGAVTENTAGTMGGGFAVPGGLVRLFATDILSNTATTDGGGITIANVGRVEATDVWVHTNTAGARGGGIAVVSYAENADPQLAMVGIYQPQEDSCSYRGAIGQNQYCSDIKANVANEGGGVYLEDGTEVIANTAIRQNNATATASALWMRNVPNGAPALAATNVLIVNNGNVANVDSVRVGGGVFVGEHVTSADNLGAPFRFTTGAPPALLQRSIVWDSANLINNAATALGATCTMFRAVTGATVGPNIAFGLDPFFVTTARGKYRLDAAISSNAVDQCAAGLAVDLDRDVRPVNALYDRGAFEAQ